MMNKKSIIKSSTTLVLLLLCTASAYSQRGSRHQTALDHADTTHFRVNKEQGWQMYNSYAESRQDSVQLELILQHSQEADWSRWQEAGRIRTASLRPRRTRTVTTRSMNAVIELEINPDGRCRLRLHSGSLPPVEPTMLAFTATYKK